MRRAVLSLSAAVLTGAAALVSGVTGCDRVRPDGGDGYRSVGSTVHRITVDGDRRTFRLYRPASVPTTGSPPLVVMLHGALGSGRQAESSYRWNAAADAGGFLVAYPDGIGRAWAVSDGCCGPPARDGVDDVAFVTRVVAEISGHVPVDPRRVYATGISNGGMLAYRLACDTTVFAAIAPVAATMLGECPAPAPVSIVHIHGTADETIPYRGGPGRRAGTGGGRFPADTTGPAVPDLIELWRTVAGCAAATETIVGAVTTSAAGCRDGRGIDLVTVAGAGHQRPGATDPASTNPGPTDPASTGSGLAGRLLGLDPPSSALDATATIWQFFAAHPAPA